MASLALLADIQEIDAFLGELHPMLPAAIVDYACYVLTGAALLLTAWMTAVVSKLRGQLADANNRLADHLRAHRKAEIETKLAELSGATPVEAAVEVGVTVPAEDRIDDEPAEADPWEMPASVVAELSRVASKIGVLFDRCDHIDNELSLLMGPVEKPNPPSWASTEEGAKIVAENGVLQGKLIELKRDFMACEEELRKKNLEIEALQEANSTLVFSNHVLQESDKSLRQIIDKAESERDAANRTLQSVRENKDRHAREIIDLRKERDQQAGLLKAAAEKQARLEEELKQWKMANAYYPIAPMGSITFPSVAVSGNLFHASAPLAGPTLAELEAAVIKVRDAWAVGNVGSRERAEMLMKWGEAEMALQDFKKKQGMGSPPQ